MRSVSLVRMALTMIMALVLSLSLGCGGSGGGGGHSGGGAAVTPTSPVCGNGTCETGESAASCAADCGGGPQASPLQGTWMMNVIGTGDAPGSASFWNYSRLQFDAAGAGTCLEYLDSAGENGCVNHLAPVPQFAISSDGIMTIPAEPAQNFHAAIGLNKNAFAGTLNDGGGALDLFTFVKMTGSGFSTADLAGTWWTHGLMTGDAPNFLAWSRLKQSFDAAGVATCLEHLNSSGDADCVSRSGWHYAVSADGVVTSSIGLSNLHGIMSPDKSMIVITWNDGGGGYGYSVSTKMGGAFSMADLQGTWWIHGVTSGDAPQPVGWFYFKVAFDGSGVATCQGGLNSQGSDPCGAGMAMTISPDGVITAGMNVHGAMSADKSLMAITMDHGGGGGYDLLIATKM